MLARFPGEAATEWWACERHLFTRNDKKCALELRPGQAQEVPRLGPEASSMRNLKSLNKLGGEPRVITARREAALVAHVRHGNVEPVRLESRPCG